MYNTQKIAERIKLQAKLRGVTMQTMLSEIGLGINTVSQIADYLDCSVDYLLCRTDNSRILNK